MAKAKKLIDELMTAPIIRYGPPTWHEQLRRTDPDLMEQIDEIIDAWIANDEQVRMVRPTKTSLAAWLTERLPGMRNASTVRDYITLRANDSTRGT